MHIPDKLDLLLIETDPHIIHFFNSFFNEIENIIIHSVSTIIDSLLYLLKKHIDIIIIGSIENIQAQELFKIFKALMPDIQYTIISDVDINTREEKQYTGYAVLQKPITNQNLSCLLDNFLSNKKTGNSSTTLLAQIGVQENKYNEKRVIVKTALEILSHDTINIFTNIFSLLDELPDIPNIAILNDYIKELYECVSEALGYIGEKKRIESVIDILNSMKIGNNRIPFTTHSRVELKHDNRKLVFIETSRLLKNALTNLIDNALKYSNISSKVTIEVRRVQNQVWIQIMDRGVGIPDNDKEKIFERGYRGRNATPISGSGFGLWITHNILHANGGTIMVRDNPGGGSIFIIKLPAFHIDDLALGLKDLTIWFKMPIEVINKKKRVIETIMELETPSPTQDTDSLIFVQLLDNLRSERRYKEQNQFAIKLKRFKELNPDSKTILLVDDSLYVHYTIAPVITGHGYRIVDYAYNGEDAINKYHIYKPDLVIMDITLPAKSGIEAAKEIYDNDKSANIIFLSALGNHKSILSNMKNLFKENNYVVLCKPIKKNKVLEAVHNFLNNKQ